MNNENPNEQLETKNDEFVNIMSDDKDNTNSSKGSKPILLLVIGLLLVVLIGVGVKYFLRAEKTNTENVYYTMIDTLADNAIKYIDSGSKAIQDLSSGEVSLKTNLTSTDQEIKPILDILNGMDIKLSSVIDFPNKKANIAYQLRYENADMLNGNLFIQNNDAYLDLGTLFNKKLALSDGSVSFDTLWNSTTSSNTEYKTIVREFAKALKKSIPSEYFTRTEEEIEVLNKSVKTYKHTLKLDEQGIKTIIENLIKEVQNNDELKDALAKELEVSKEDIDTVLNGLLEDVNVDPVNVEINIYLNAKNNDLEKAEIKTSNDINLIKTGKDTFDLVVDDVTYGTLVYNDKEFAITLKDEDLDTEIVISIKDDEIKLVFNLGFYEINFGVDIKTSGNTTTIVIDADAEGVKGSVTLTVKEGTIKEVPVMDVTNAVNIDNLTEEDQSTIMANILQNSAFSNLIGKIMEYTNSETNTDTTGGITM